VNLVIFQVLNTRGFGRHEARRGSPGTARASFPRRQILKANIAAEV